MRRPTSDAAARALASSIQWKNKIAEELTARLKERPEILRLRANTALAIKRLTECGGTFAPRWSAGYGNGRPGSAPLATGRDYLELDRNPGRQRPHLDGRPGRIRLARPGEVFRINAVKDARSPSSCWLKRR